MDLGLNGRTAIVCTQVTLSYCLRPASVIPDELTSLGAEYLCKIADGPAISMRLRCTR